MYQFTTALWYRMYQWLVHEIPTVGTSATNGWYMLYQRLVRGISQVGI
ncbi:hypothetical protein [Bacteroides eggerthii]|nr:hypothetical protein [Bacteroides eggerthii]